MSIQDTKDSFIMPQSQIAEKAIFSLLMAHPEKFVEVSDYLEQKDFYNLTHQEIWQAVSSLSKAGQDIDIVSAKMELVKQGSDAGPATKELANCFEETSPWGGNLLNFAKEIKNKSMLRKILETTYRNSANARLDDANAITILGAIEKEIIDIVDLEQESRAIDSEGIINEINADIAKGQEGGWKGFNTGFADIDSTTGGFIPTHCWIVGAYTGVGKTFMILQMLLNVLKQNGKVMLFSTEMDRKMNMLRLISNLAGLGTIQVLKGLLNAEEKVRMVSAQETLRSYKKNLTIYDDVYTVEQIRLKAKKRCLKEGLDIIFVDFIQNLRGSENIYERMSNAALELQKIAQELNVTIVIASQVSQESAGWKSKDSIDYKGAGEIAAIADVGIWIKKVDSDKSLREVVLRKVRHGIPGSTEVRISFPSGRVIDMNSNDSIGEEVGNVQQQL